MSILEFLFFLKYNNSRFRLSDFWCRNYKILRREDLEMTDTEKLILEKLDYLTDDMQSVKQEVQSVRKDMRSMDLRLSSEIQKLKVTLENDISRKIDIIGEGHDFLKQRLDEALLMEKKREAMELELINLRMDVKKIKEHLHIA